MITKFSLMEQILHRIADWCNLNSGFLTLVVFIMTVFIGWISGFFKFIKKRPKFKIRLIDGPTFFSIINLNKNYRGFPVHKTAFSLYLEIANIGYSSSTIGPISLGYYKEEKTWRPLARRNWINETILKSDMIVKFKDSTLVKVYPFLKQKSTLLPAQIDIFLELGKIINGITYFEEFESYGNWKPRLNKDQKSTNIKIRINDGFGNSHTKRFNIKIIDSSQALEMSRYFGQTYSEYTMQNEDSNSQESK